MLAYFETLDTIAIRDPEGIFNGHHEATLIRNKRTGQLFVVDSWMDHGGSPTRVYKFDTWLKGKDDDQVSFEAK